MAKKKSDVDDVTELRGILKRPRKRAVTVEEMNAAIRRAHAEKRSGRAGKNQRHSA